MKTARSTLTAILCILLLTAFPVSVFASGDEGGGAVPSVSEQYNSLLTHYANGEQYFSEINLDYPDWYGGAYVSGEKLIIHVTELTDEVRNELTAITGNPDLIIQEAAHSFEDLVAAQAMLDAVWTQSGKLELKRGAQVVGSGLSVNQNTVRLYVSGIDSEETVSLESVLPAAAGTDLASVRVALVRGQAAVPADTTDSAPVFDSTGPVFILPIIIVCLVAAALVIVILKHRRKKGRK